MIHASRILVIIGSTRARRIGPQVADWVMRQGRERIAGMFEIADLKRWRLPMDDEPDIPAGGAGYKHRHTRLWSRKVAASAAFVFVTPQYNWGYPAPLKNALDHLYKEWSDKPAIVVTYGSRGGGKCAAQLRQVLEGLNMKPVATMPGLRLSRERIEANAGAIEPDREFEGHVGEVQQAFGELAAALGNV
jgi:NAD(P)H-dependent FMN reductase